MLRKLGETKEGFAAFVLIIALASGLMAVGVITLLTPMVYLGEEKEIKCIDREEIEASKILLERLLKWETSARSGHIQRVRLEHDSLFDEGGWIAQTEKVLEILSRL
jgi:hypothetical protein